jgi:hypothetical protein
MRTALGVNMLDEADIPDAVSGPARSAVLANADRVNRALEVGDVEQVVGTAKDLVESVTKVVLQALGTTFGSGETLPRLGRRALQGLGAHPQSFEDRPPLRNLANALVQVPDAISTLRNRDGTGHGRPFLSDLSIANAEFTGHVALAWSRWVLAALGRVLAGMAAVDEAARRIEDRWEPFPRGSMRTVLGELRLPELEPIQQHRLGLAVGRRSVKGTWVADLDIVEPLAAGEEPYPSHFAVGVIEGFFIDVNGYIRCRVGGAQLAVEITRRLGAEGPDVLVGIAERLEGSELAYAFDDDQVQRAVIAELRELADKGSDESVQEALRRMAVRIETLSAASSQP